MTSADFKPPRMTMKNTKREMLAAYNEVLQRLTQKREAELKPEEEIKEKEQKQAVTLADTLTTEGIVQDISALKLETGRLLGQVSDRLEEEVNKYRQVKRAVEVRESELQEIYEIEKSTLSLAALIEAQHQKRQEIETELAARKEQLIREIESQRADWQKESKLHEEAVKERDAAEKKQREREREEYVYTFQREQQLAREQYEDQKTRLEREIASRKEQMERELAERERVVAEKEGELNELRKQVSAFPKELESAVSKAVKEAVQKVELDARNSETILNKEFEGERNVMNARIQALEKTVKEQNEQITRLSQQVEKSYSQVQDIAVKAIEGTSHTQPPTNLQQLMAEQVRKPLPEK